MYERVTWPDQYHPRISPLYANNDIDVQASPSIVWKLIVAAENWASYFPPENHVTISNGLAELTPHGEFTRVTVGFAMGCTVLEYEPERRISWATTSIENDETGSTAYHGWVITPTETGCHVLTEETLQGRFFLEELGYRHPGAAYAYHEQWLQGLAKAAAAETRSTSN